MLQAEKHRLAKLIIAAMCVSGGIGAVSAEEQVELTDIQVIGTTPLHGVGLPADQIPTNVQAATAEDIENSQSLDISDFMNRTLGSVNLNAAQNNPFQPDLQFRGFTASPLVGNAQGLSVYQDGVRVNEPFGDAVNFELIPESAIASMNLIPGSNPLFGLNTLGGAISIQTKNGFDNPGHELEAYTGSFGRDSGTISSGGNNGTFGYFVTGSITKEDGWRDFSPSRVEQFFSNLSYRNTDTTLDLGLTAVDSDLNGNGPAPIELLAIDREQVFTYPDNTENELRMATLNGSHWVSDNVILSANTYFRNNDRSTFNGDGAELEIDSGFLVEEDGDGTDADDRILDSSGAEITSAALGDPDDDLALNNTSETEQDSYGFGLQSTFLNDLFGKENQLIVGATYDQSNVDYNARSEVAVFRDDRGTDGTGVVIADSVVDANIDSYSVGLFFTDTISVTEQLALTLGGRYNYTKIDISGTSGLDDSDNPASLLDTDLDGIDDEDGEHSFARFNPSLGLTYTVNERIGVYGSYSESNRAPTPSELTCANPARPCALPNSFLSDPPLDDVVAKTFEGGIRGQFANNINWSLGFFRTLNKDDIVFMPVEEDESEGRLAAGVFDNVDETKRQGIELSLSGQTEKMTWFTHYSYIEATYESGFDVYSPNHPNGEAVYTVESGDYIPGIPKHNVKVGMDYAFTPKFSLGFDASYYSDQYYRGDESNDGDKLDGYTLVNVHGRYKVTKHVEFFAKVDNLFDRDYESFGLYGEPDEAPGLDSLDDSRFQGAGAPRAGWIGVKVRL
jgi:outer membrane receptor protein involved in Fe transport